MTSDWPPGRIPRRRVIRDGAVWPRDDIARRLNLSVAFACRVLATLTSPAARDRADALEPMRDKVVAEAAMLLHCAAAVAPDDRRLTTAVHSLAAALAPLARSEATVAAVCAAPGRAADVAIAHAVLSAFGNEDEDFDALLASARSSTGRRGPEELPFARLEHEWIARTWPRGLAVSVERGLLARSMLGRPLDVLAATRLDVYAFTHCVMYTTDFGGRTTTLPRPVSAILADAEAALALTLDIDDFDVTCEVTMTWPMLHQAWSSAAAFAFRLMAEAMDDAGFLRGPEFDPDRSNHLTGNARDSYIAATSYHTTFVMGMLCAACLRDGCQPPIDTGPVRWAGAASRLAQFETSGARLPWRRVARASSAQMQDSLSPLLLTSLLRSAKDRGDLRQVAALIDVALTAGLSNCAVVREAADVLRRTALGQRVLHPAARRC